MLNRKHYFGLFLYSLLLFDFFEVKSFDSILWSLGFSKKNFTKSSLAKKLKDFVIMNFLWQLWFSAVSRRRRFLFLLRFLFWMLLSTLLTFLVLIIYGYGYLIIFSINITHAFLILYERRGWIVLKSLGLLDGWIQGLAAGVQTDFALLLIVKWLLINFQRFSNPKFGVWETRIRLHFEAVLLITSS